MHTLVLVLLVGLVISVGVLRFGRPWQRERTSVTADEKRRFVEALLPHAEAAMRQRGASDAEIASALAKVRAAERAFTDSTTDRVPGAW
jgi:hypothetical protein